MQPDANNRRPVHSRRQRRIRVPVQSGRQHIRHQRNGFQGCWQLAARVSRLAIQGRSPGSCKRGYWRLSI